MHENVIMLQSIVLSLGKFYSLVLSACSLNSLEGIDGSVIRGTLSGKGSPTSNASSPIH